MIGLARLFAGNYKLVLLDEPTSGINPELFDTISGMLKSMVEDNKLSVLYIEHNMDFVKTNADYVAYLAKGKVAVQGNFEEVLSNEMVINNYAGKIEKTNAEN